jgi:hypothetical protein
MSRPRPLLEQEWAKALALALVRYEPTPVFDELVDEWGHNPLAVSHRAEMAGA